MGRCMKSSTWSKAGQSKREIHSNTVENKECYFPSSDANGTLGYSIPFRGEPFSSAYSPVEFLPLDQR
jgi:hypothetical protein